MKKALGVIGAISIAASALLAPAAHAALYTFTSHTFTSCGSIGPTGPTQTSCRTAYSTAWDENNSYYTVTGGIQYWTVPASGRYYIDAYGAGGGHVNFGGGGARIADTFDLTEGEVIRILVGQTETPTSTGANSGGGGTFVVRTPFNTNGSILVIAGGGGGAESASTQQTNAHASITTSGNQGTGTVSVSNSGAGGVNGNGGGAATSDNSGGGGGGFFTDGARSPTGDSNGGYAFVNGGAGGPTGTTLPTIAGGFGGGGGSRSTWGGGAGGGGGYSGGGGGDNVVNYAGGGGGSYFANGLNINRVTTIDANPQVTNGYVTITALAPPTASLAVAGGVTTITKGQTIQLTVTVDQAGRVTFYADKKRIAGCINLVASVGSKVCNWKPTVQRAVQIYAQLTQNGSVIANSSVISLDAKKRTGTR